MSKLTPEQFRVVKIDWAENGNARYEVDCKTTGLAYSSLISAAPDMYEALKRIEPIIEALEVLNLGKAEPGSLATQLRAALAKADGK